MPRARLFQVENNQRRSCELSTCDVCGPTKSRPQTESRAHSAKTELSRLLTSRLLALLVAPREKRRIDFANGTESDRVLSFARKSVPAMNRGTRRHSSLKKKSVFVCHIREDVSFPLLVSSQPLLSISAGLPPRRYARRTLYVSARLPDVPF